MARAVQCVWLACVALLVFPAVVDADGEVDYAKLKRKREKEANVAPQIDMDTLIGKGGSGSKMESM
ncbi:hypothetical protein FB451DRAFT_1395568 [Mycena latifolia]|nr:hypothetical protein FB451DRAFT_1395568 [Mycena latifolia]